jgi:hypothetical protein
VDIKVTNLATFVKIDPPNTQVSAKLYPIQAFLSLSAFKRFQFDMRVLKLIENKRGAQTLLECELKASAGLRSGD